MRLYIALSLASLILLSGCSGIKTYPNNLEQNLHIKTETDSGSMFTKVRAAVDIYKVGKDCETEYEGTVQLQESLVDVGIPVGRMSYLVFAFENSGFLSSSSSTISQETLLKPRAGYHYDIKVSYMDAIYYVEVWERHPRKAKSREVEQRSLDECSES